MKPNDIRLGTSYAIKLRLRKAAGMPAGAPITQAVCMDREGSRVVMEIDGWKPKPGKAADAAAGKLIGNSNFEPCRKLITVKASDVVCPSDEWHGKPKPDGRIDKPETLRVGDTTFTSQRLAG